jgi:hypothetical protein
MAKEEWFDLYTFASAARRINRSEEWVRQLVLRGDVGTIEQAYVNRAGHHRVKKYVNGRSLRAWAEGQVKNLVLDYGL